MNTIYGIYNYIKSWIPIGETKYINQFAHIEYLENCDDFVNFTNSTIEFSKLIFALNNFPDQIYCTIFSKYDHTHICQKYYTISLVMDNEQETYLLKYNNLDDISTNMDKTYIYIRVELFCHNRMGNIHHVNSIVINNSNKTVLIFEPQGSLKYDKALISLLLNTNSMNIREYTFIDPVDIGYNIFNRLQLLDCFCQTYVLYIFILIIDNPMVKYKDYSHMFNTIITTKNMGYFLFYLYLEFKSINIDVSLSENYEWYFPKNGFNKIINTLRIVFKNAFDDKNVSEDHIQDNINSLDIITNEDDYIIVNRI
ncbi:MAG: hypothetical protein Homavirus17_7 [Homavirus sp.]|uniref:Uncharacterized protein n=1 Tax=Homavirus sp. TaxID=2487769 RepID=A0A3G5AA52_9VIRU|nr:MAG: hypothetical protein Homavirus17_7 [Homavirus sp.]